MSSGLELDTSRRRPPAEPARTPSQRVRPERPRREKPEPDPVDPSTHGAAMMIALGYLVWALVVIVRERAGIELVVAAAIASVFTYGVYWFTGFLARHTGMIGVIFLGGWFQFVLGAIAQILYQLVNIRWWVVGVAYALVSVVALAR